MFLIFEILGSWIKWFLTCPPPKRNLLWVYKTCATGEIFLFLQCAFLIQHFADIKVGGQRAVASIGNII